jgi:2-polyprenyl-3-methyl-5-hydroxy-6-metoxy-1,4-benzoquinol methylase
VAKADEIVEELEAAVQRLEELVSSQRTFGPQHYDKPYFTDTWRERNNRYDLETRRHVEGPNPQLIAEVLAPASVLDVGCGPGFLMHFLAELGIDTHGVDFSESTKSLAPADVRERIRLGPADDLTEPDLSHDLVICREVFEHLTVLQVRRAVAEICRVSARLVYATARFHPAPQDLLDVTDDLETDPTHITLMTKPLLRTLFVLEGFRARPDLEDRLDWGRKGRVLVYERRA